jgi:ribose transport system permease protein
MRGNGRLLSVRPGSGAPVVIAKNLMFPMGVCVERGGESLLFSEAWRCRIGRYWLQGPRKGQIDPVCEGLPGFPASITPSSDGNFWVAMVGMRTPLHDLSMRAPGFRRRMVQRVASDEWLSPNFNAGFVIKLSREGHILQRLADAGPGFSALTCVREHHGHLYLGGAFDNRLARLELPTLLEERVAA